MRSLSTASYEGNLACRMRPVAIFLPRYTNLYRSIAAYRGVYCTCKKGKNTVDRNIMGNLKHLDVILIYPGIQCERNLMVSNDNF